RCDLRRAHRSVDRGTPGARRADALVGAPPEPVGAPRVGGRPDPVGASRSRARSRLSGRSNAARRSRRPDPESGRLDAEGSGKDRSGATRTLPPVERAVDSPNHVALRYRAVFTDQAAVIIESDTSWELKRPAPRHSRDNRAPARRGSRPTSCSFEAAT